LGHPSLPRVQPRPARAQGRDRRVRQALPALRARRRRALERRSGPRTPRAPRPHPRSRMKDLAGKTAVVTGAASGMGRAFAERFADEGMNIVLADVEVPRLDEATESVKSRGVDVIAVATDVSDPQAVDRLRDAALERFGRVNVLCNNAGVAG